MSLISLVLLAASTPAIVAHEIPVRDQVDASFEALASGENRQAIEAIDRSEALGEADPARLINLGIALAREGRADEARALFEAARSADTRYRLETAGGDWVDSRHLASRALAMLDAGEFVRSNRMAQR